MRLILPFSQTKAYIYRLVGCLRARSTESLVLAYVFTHVYTHTLMYLLFRFAFLEIFILHESCLLLKRDPSTRCSTLDVSSLAVSLIG